MRRKEAAASRLDACPEIRLTNCTALMMVYMAARIQFVVMRRIKSSNLEDVGHILSRKGISTKRIMNAKTLRASVG